MATEHEYRFKLMVRSILRPLGKGEFGDTDAILDHLQEVFGIKNSNLCLSVLKEEVNMKPVELEIDLFEATNLKDMDPNGLSDPYCTFGLLLPHNFDGQGDIRPQIFNQGLSKPHVLCSTTKKKTLSPVWQERFRLDVSNMANQILVVCIWDDDQEQNTFWEDVKTVDKPSGIVNLFRQMKQSLENKKNVDDFIGVVAIPLKDIPPTGLDRWFDIRAKLKKNSKITGKLHLGLTLSCKQDPDMCDSVESDQCSLEDYYLILKEMHSYSAQTKQDSEFYDGVLPKESQIALQIFSVQNQVVHTTQDLLNLLVFMERNAEKRSPPVADDVILQCFTTLSRNINTSWELVSCSGGSSTNMCLFTDFELALFDRITASFIRYYLCENKDLDSYFFALTPTRVRFLQEKLSLLDQIPSLGASTWTPSYKLRLNEHLEFRVQLDVDVWISEHLLNTENTDKDAILHEMAHFTNVITELASHCSVDNVLYQLPFESWGFNYNETVALAVDTKLYPFCSRAMEKMQHYQTRYKRFHVNIRDSCSVSIAFYSALRMLISTLEHSLKSRKISQCSTVSSRSLQLPLRELKLLEYRNWFGECFLNLLYVYKCECYQRVNRAVDFDPKMTEVAPGVDFSTSAVYVLNCFERTLSEWRELNIENNEIQTAFLIKLTDVICDGSKLYAEKMEEQAKYTCSNQNVLPFIVPRQFCLCLNNLDHVWEYMQNLPRRMKWEEATDMVATSSGISVMKTHTMNILHKLYQSADQQVSGIRERVLEILLEMIGKHISACLGGWLKPQQQCKDADKLLAYLDKNLRILHHHLKPNMFTLILNKVWVSILREVIDGFRNGMKPEYAQMIYQHLQVVREYFLSLGLHDCNLNNLLIEELMRTLRYHSMSTIDLQLEYYNELASQMKTPGGLGYIGHLAFRAGYKSSAENHIDLIVKVLNAQSLPGLDRSGLSDPFVIVGLRPCAMFPGFQPQRTHVRYQTVDPVYNETFEFPNIPAVVLTMKGAVLHLMVVDRDTITSNDFAGEVFLNFSDVRDLSKFLSIDFLPVHMLALKRFVNTQYSYQVLQQRASWDKIAKSFVQMREKLSCGNMVENCQLRKRSFCGLFG
ncbi:BAI1-associated protein 3-like isoform X2 [Tachypleus tridentatus]